MPSLPRTAALLACVACANPASGPVVQAPSVVLDAPVPRAAARHGNDTLSACALPWTLENVDHGAGRVVVVCASDVRREDVAPGPMTHALELALEPVRERVCACVARMPAPAFVDLEVTTVPDDGRVSGAVSEPDEDLDPEMARAFVACLGAVTASVATAHVDSCGPDKVTLVYPLRVDLTH